jgi:hypothetical protein
MIWLLSISTDIPPNKKLFSVQLPRHVLAPHLYISSCHALECLDPTSFPGEVLYPSQNQIKHSSTLSGPPLSFPCGFSPLHTLRALTCDNELRLLFSILLILPKHTLSLTHLSILSIKPLHTFD